MLDDPIYLFFIVIIATFCFTIYNTKSGRCFRYEYIIRTITTIILFVFIPVILTSPIRTDNSFSPTEGIGMLFMILLFYYYLKITIQRLYDINLSKWFILIAVIPTINTIFILFLFIKKGTNYINKYDKAIDYKKIIQDKHFIDIHEKQIFFDDEEYKYELNLTKYIIKIPKKDKINIFTEYLFKNYPINETQIEKIVEISKDDLKYIIEKLSLIEVVDSFYVKLKNIDVFIRNENFNFTIVVNKNNNTNELFKNTGFYGFYYEDESNIYFNKIKKREIKKWVNNVA